MVLEALATNFEPTNSPHWAESGDRREETLAGAAVNAAKKNEPSKDEIGGFLDTALKTARGPAEFVSVTAKLAPYVRTVASWLGGQWINLASLLT